MSSPVEQPSLVLIRRLVDGTIEWIPVEIPQRVPSAPAEAYALIDRAAYEAPQTLVAQRLGDDLVVEVQGIEVLVLAGFFATADVGFYPTTDIAGGAGPFGGLLLSPETPVLPGSPAGLVWSASHGDDDPPSESDTDTAEDAQSGSAQSGSAQSGSAGSPLLWGGLALGGLGLALAAGGGGGGDSSGNGGAGGGTGGGGTGGGGTGGGGTGGGGTDGGDTGGGDTDGGDTGGGDTGGGDTGGGDTGGGGTDGGDTGGGGTDGGTGSPPPGTADETPPTVSNIALSAIGAQNNLLNTGDTVSVTVTMSENVVVDTSGGTPRIALSIGGNTAYADYASGSGTTRLVFEHTVQPGVNDSNGISIPSQGLERNGGSLTDATGNAADLGHGALVDQAAFAVDTTAPTLSSSDPGDNRGRVSVDEDIVLTFSEDMQIGSGNILISDGSGDTRTISVDDASQVSIRGNQVTIDPASDLNTSSTYSVQIDRGALTDLAGNPYAGVSGSDTLNFETRPNARAGVDLGAGDTWAGSDNLGSDDKIALVGAGAPVAEPAGAAGQEAVTSTAISESAPRSFDAGMLQDTTLLPTSPLAQANIHFSNLPAGLLTSQGLV